MVAGFQQIPDDQEFYLAVRWTAKAQNVSGHFLDRADCPNETEAIGDGRRERLEELDIDAGVVTGP